MEPRLQLIQFLQKRISQRDAQLSGDTPLVSSGLLDSFDLVEVVHQLETVTGRRLPAGLISPQDLDTIDQMLATVERLGEPPRDS